MPGQTHDAIAVYEMIFQTPGTYTAYYRTRGPNSASNSIYSPDGFGTDPDNLQTLTEDGTFSWIKRHAIVPDQRVKRGRSAGVAAGHARGPVAD